MTSDFNDLVQELRGCQGVYDLLARLFRSEVDGELLGVLRAIELPDAEEDGPVRQGAALMRGYLATAWENTLLELARDYVRAFIGHGLDGHAAAYPYESVYTSPKRLLMQAARDEVRADYLAWGVARTKDWHEGEDHAALELEFCGLLAGKAADALQVGDVPQAARCLHALEEFLVKHPCRWFDEFASDVERFAQTDFYRGLAKLTSGFVVAGRDFACEACAELDAAVPVEPAAIAC